MVLWKLSDARLVRRSQRGDSSAFVTLLQRFDDRLRELVYALVVDEAAMDRVLRAAYIKAWRDVVRTASDVDVGVWLYRLAYNAAIDELRHQQVGWNPSSDGPDAGAAAALAAVPPEQRVALVLVDREEFTPAAAARILGVTQETFDERLSAARACMTDALSHLGGADGHHDGDGRGRDPAGDALYRHRRPGRWRPAHRSRTGEPVAAGEPVAPSDDAPLDEAAASSPSEGVRR